MKLEDAFQIDAMKDLAVLLHQDALAFHVPNGGKRHVWEAAKFKRMGVVPGIPDILILQGGHLYGIELKVGKAKQTGSQKQIESVFEKCGASYVVCRTREEIRNQIITWGISRETT